jgi:hypothetical protein
MDRSLFSLRRGLLGLAFVSSLGFGATQALASPELARSGSCQPTGQLYIPDDCPECGGTGGYCDGYNTDCVCFE